MVLGDWTGHQEGMFGKQLAGAAGSEAIPCSAVKMKDMKEGIVDHSLKKRMTSN